MPLAGVPHHSLERHLATLISRGHRVAICEQLTAAPVRGEAAGRGLIERDVVRVVTPGTVLETGLLQSKVNNYLAAFVTDGRRAGIAYADVTTGDFQATELDADAALSELQRIAPSEVLVAEEVAAQVSGLPGFITRRPDDGFDPGRARRVLQQHFGARTLAPFGLVALAARDGRRRRRHLVPVGDAGGRGRAVDAADELQPRVLHGARRAGRAQP